MSVPTFKPTLPNLTGLTETLTEGLEKIGDQVDKIGDRVWDFLPAVFGMTGPEGKPLQPKTGAHACLLACLSALLHYVDLTPHITDAKAASTSERTFRSKVEAMQVCFAARTHAHTISC